ncbi:hypothetical protein [Synechococcus sp. WH 8016]|uniref:hypothetical protein n=1 Tax=Synechococcus sp. WH 8016 TaxID=166318 RepID=UPI000237D62E|nr:hypothetical protein [Synechococcus sp. WH 8016]EHA61986.1 hypothetical protein Syn8016DRAFT_2058 [Synechococcus sp. WH 8016]
MAPDCLDVSQSLQFLPIERASKAQVKRNQSEEEMLYMQAMHTEPRGSGQRQTIF